MPEYDATVIYKDIPGFPGYKAGSDGTIWSSRSARFGSTSYGDWRQLKTTTPRRYHRAVLLGKYHHVHTLILRTFVGPPPDGMECCHNDGDGSNNELTNLRWDTRRANCLDKKRHGTGSAGTKNCKAKVTEAVVREVRQEYARGVATQAELSAKYGVHQTTVSRILLRKSWGSV